MVLWLASESFPSNSAFFFSNIKELRIKLTGKKAQKVNSYVCVLFFYESQLH